MPKYTDDEIRNMKKITCKIAGEYLGISSMAVSMGMRNNLLPIGFAIHNEENDRPYSESWSYHIIADRLIAYKYVDKRNIISDGIPKIEAYMKDVLPNDEDKKKSLDDIGSICVDTSEYI